MVRKRADSTQEGKPLPGSAKPEEQVRRRVIKQLEDLGWGEGQLQFKPEWAIPDTPHDLTKRERNQKYEICGTADLVAFADYSHQWHALQVVFEFKAPTIDKGRAQLYRYLSNEPMAKMGYWTNGTDSLAIYKRHLADWLEVKGAPLPRPTDDLTQPPGKAATWNDLVVPTEAELSAVLRRLVATVVVSDAHVTRREDQLRELIHILFVKLESDAVASKSSNHDKDVEFRIYGDTDTKVEKTSEVIRKKFSDYFHRQRNRIFNPNDQEKLLLTDETIYAVVAELAGFRILGDNLDVLAKAFQIFRTSALRSGEGQYLTPLRIVRPTVIAMEITSQDKVIDPACGTGTFLVEALRQVEAREFPTPGESWNLIKWANENLYGIDKDDIGAKLTRAIMTAMRDGSSHVLLGDAIRTNQWAQKYHQLSSQIGKMESPFVESQFTVVITNPPFGESLKVSAADCRAAGYTISNAAAMKGPHDYVDLEIGLVYLELSHRLLVIGGRVGMVLPETYFFSHSYRWLPDWLSERFELRGMLNVPMEAFEEFCRAKTNFYIFEKIGDGPIPETSKKVQSA